MTTAKKKILFLCTGNAARSQMAEALARIDYADLLAPVSAGSRPAGFVHPLAVVAIEELGFSMRDAWSKSAEEFEEEPLDLVVTLCDSAAEDCPTWPTAARIEHWSIDDPSFGPGSEGARLAAFRATRNLLRRRIDELGLSFAAPAEGRTDGQIVDGGSRILGDLLREHGFRSEGVRERREGQHKGARARHARKGRAVELQSRSGVGIAVYEAGGVRLLHPEYMERLHASGEMRYPGYSRDPLDAFRRLRADLIRFGRPFLSGKGLDEFRSVAVGGSDPAAQPPRKTATAVRLRRS